jgi:hypothetical protein
MMKQKLFSHKFPVIIRGIRIYCIFYAQVHCKLVGTKSNMTHNLIKLPQVKDNKSCEAYFALHVSNMPHHFFDTWCAIYASSEANRG